jgi:GDP-L-fucose synthase
MYPRVSPDLLREEMVLSGPLEPSNEGYALAKIVTARLCKYIREADSRYQYKTIIPCNLYGRFDKFDPVHSHLVPAIIHKTHVAMQTGRSSIEIWGDGSARREFMYAGDFSDALVHALGNFEGMPFDLNIGLGVDYSVQEYYEAVAATLGYSGKFDYILDKPVGMMRKLVSIERQQAWGWTPKTALVQGIRKTVDFYFQTVVT